MEQERKYINRIRNERKRAYAEEVFKNYKLGKPSPDFHKYGISIMAAQAVDIDLRNVLR